MTAPAPSPAEQAVIDRFGIFDEERVVEEVARAIAEREGHRWDRLARPLADRSRRLAAAAVTAYRAQSGGAEEAVRRVSAQLDDLATSKDPADRYIVRLLRAALAPQAGDGAR